MPESAGVIRIPYSPRPLQAELHQKLDRFNVLVCHRRFGKTVFAINQLLKDLFMCPHANARAAYLSPLYSQSKKVAWDYVKHFSRAIPGAKFNEQELRADFADGSRLQLFGCDSPDTLRGQYYDSVCLDEFAQMSPRVWSEVIRPALSDRQGRAIFIGTPMGHNNFYDRYMACQSLDGWYSALYKASDTGVVAEEELAAAKREMTDAEYQQEFECSWSAAIRGAYWAKEMAQAEDEGRITSVPYDDQHPVITSWDLGIKDSTVIWFAQEVGSQVRFINCMAFQGTGLPDMVRELNKLPYIYSQHKAPHDINVRELGSGVDRKTTAAQLGINFDVAPTIPVQDGIQAVRSLIGRAVFDREKCRDGIEALIQYRTEYNDKRNIFSNTPLHDWSSDYADSMRYYAVCPSSYGYGQELDYSMANAL